MKRIRDAQHERVVVEVASFHPKRRNARAEWMLILWNIDDVSIWFRRQTTRQAALAASTGRKGPAVLHLAFQTLVGSLYGALSFHARGINNIVDLVILWVIGILGFGGGYVIGQRIRIEFVEQLGRIRTGYRAEAARRRPGSTRRRRRCSR